ncbi:hypothetical protein ACKKBG_A28725 [Auxenochlorella protothecoides x Auxenochlorella symbiontica]
MDYEAGTYQKLPIKQYPARELGETAEGRYWRRFLSPATAKQAGAVNYLEFCPVRPYNLAVTSSTRVLVYDGATRSLHRTINRFKDKAYSASWRADGKLLVAGGQDGIVQLFDVGSRSLLRQFKAHKRPVHVARFDPGRMHVLSGGDDATVRWWDVSEGKQVSRWEGHSDYVRAAAVNPAAHGTWATGGYDHVCKVWDARSAQSVLSVDHGAPIEAVAFFPSGSVLVTAGGTQVRVWDLFGGGRELACLSNHQKTVTCVTVSPNAGPDSSAAPRLLTGALDGHLKVYELERFQVTHIQKYPGPILSLGLSGDAGLLAVGLADGTLTVRKHAKPRADPAKAGILVGRRSRRAPALTAATYRYFIRGQSSKAAAKDSVIAAERKAALAVHDKFLRKFRYRDALDAALSTRRAEVVASVVEELAARGGLSSALSSRDAAGLAPLLDHMRRNINDPRHAPQLAALAHRLLDVYGGSEALTGMLPALTLLLERVELELRAQDGLTRVQGMLGPLLAASVGAC